MPRARSRGTSGGLLKSILAIPSPEKVFHTCCKPDRDTSTASGTLCRCLNRARNIRTPALACNVSIVTCPCAVASPHTPFGVARLDTLDEYRSLFTAAGLREVESHDVGELVVPTLDAWEQNIRAQRERLDVCFDDGRLEDFLESCRILRRLFAAEGWGYGIVRGRK